MHSFLIERNSEISIRQPSIRLFFLFLANSSFFSSDAQTRDEIVSRRKQWDARWKVAISWLFIWPSSPLAQSRWCYRHDFSTTFPLLSWISLASRAGKGFFLGCKLFVLDHWLEYFRTKDNFFSFSFENHDFCSSRYCSRKWESRKWLSCKNCPVRIVGNANLWYRIAIGWTDDR